MPTAPVNNSTGIPFLCFKGDVMRASIWLGLAVVLACFWLPDVRAQQPETTVGKLPPRKLIHFEFLLIERAAGDLAGEKNKMPTVEQLLQLEKDGKAAHVQRLKISVLEKVEARLQLGEDAPFVTSRTSRGGGGFGGAQQESVSYNSLGTTLTLTAETESDGNVLASLNLVRSTVAPQKTEKGEEQEASAAYPRRLSGTIVTTIRIQAGEPALIGGQQTLTGSNPGDLWIIATAKVE